MVSGISSTLRIKKLCLVTERVIPETSASWNESLPILAKATWPQMQISGTPSMKAVANPVTVLVAPGPEVTRQHPGRPVARA